MTTPGDDYIGFRNKARENQRKTEALIQALEAEEVEWGELELIFYQSAMKKQKDFDQIIDAMPEDDPDNHRYASLLAASMETSSNVDLIGRTVSKVGAQLLQVHQRLAAVEKELQDLKAAMGR